MPGIAGIIRKGPLNEARAALERMTRSMMHEPFYVSGTYANEELGLAIGWTAQAGSFADPGEIWNERRDTGIVFSGEIYAEPDDLWRLRKRGHLFEPSKAAYLGPLYEEQGIEFLQRLNGWFSGLGIDLREKKMVLFNDRFGVNRIFWHETNDAVYFASEAKAILEVRPELRTLDFQSVGEFISCSGILQNRSLFSGISALPGGSAWTFSGARPVTKGRFFKQEDWENQSSLGGDEYYEKLKETWQRILPRYFAGNDRVGLSLTGGVDSR